MKEQRRRLPQVISPLEMLDDRIVPSTFAPVPTKHAAMVAHPSIQANVHHVQAHRHHVQMLRLAAHRVSIGQVPANVPTVATVTAPPSDPVAASPSTPASGS